MRPENRGLCVYKLATIVSTVKVGHRNRLLHSGGSDGILRHVSDGSRGDGVGRVRRCVRQQRHLRRLAARRQCRRSRRNLLHVWPAELSVNVGLHSGSAHQQRNAHASLQKSGKHISVRISGWHVRIYRCGVYEHVDVCVGQLLRRLECQILLLHNTVLASLSRLR